MSTSIALFAEEMDSFLLARYELRPCSALNVVFVVAVVVVNEDDDAAHNYLHSAPTFGLTNSPSTPLKTARSQREMFAS